MRRDYSEEQIVRRIARKRTLQHRRLNERSFFRFGERDWKLNRVFLEFRVYASCVDKLYDNRDSFLFQAIIVKLTICVHTSLIIKFNNHYVFKLLIINYFS